MGRLSGKVAIITGAAGGQGAAEAKLFALEGAKVVATDVQDELLQQTVKEINAEVGSESVIGLKLDVSNEQQWIEVVNKTVENFGTVDILVNNAAIFGKLGASVVDVPAEEWDAVFKVNAAGNFYGIKHVAPIMKEKKSGSIVNISSIAGILGGMGSVPYTASKGATRLLTKAVAVELGEYQIRVNSVHPGSVLTPALEKNATPEIIERMAKNNPLNFVGSSMDIAYPVLFLASDESRYMTGTEIIVDGGFSAR